MDGGDLREPAVHPPASARGDKNDIAIRKIGRFKIIEYTRCQLPQVFAIDVDFIEVIVLLAALAIGEDDFPGIIADAGVTDSAFSIINKDSEGASLHVPATQSPVLAIIYFLVRGAPIAEVCIPVPVICLASR